MFKEGHDRAGSVFQNNARTEGVNLEGRDTNQQTVLWSRPEMVAQTQTGGGDGGGEDTLVMWRSCRRQEIFRK